METSTKDTESNTINIFTIHNKYWETREIALADTDNYDVDIADEDDKDNFTSLDTDVRTEPHICVMAGETPLVLCFDGNIYGKNNDWKWIIINPNQWNSDQDDNVDLQAYIEWLEKELSSEDLSEVMIDLINKSEFMNDKKSTYIPEVSFTWYGEQITMTVILRPKPFQLSKWSLSNVLLKPISFNCLIKNSSGDSVFIWNPQEIDVGISTAKEKVEHGFTDMNAQFKLKLWTDKKEVKSLKIKKGKLMVTYQTKKS
jgi:hypothetical protein